MRILVPTDFSKNAFHATEYASVFAKATLSELVLIHVLPLKTPLRRVPYPLIAEEILQLKKDVSDKLDVIVAAMHDRYGVRCKTLVMIGVAVEEIVCAARANDIDLIIMGTQGASGLRKALFGTNTTAVIDSASCPVLSVPQDTEIALPKNLLFCTNYHETDLRALKALVKLVRTVDGKLTLLHVSKEQRFVERQLMEEFCMMVSKETGYWNARFYTVPHDDVQQGIEVFVESSGADLVAMSMQKRSVFQAMFDPSLTRRMAFHPQLPLLAFHAAVADESFEDTPAGGAVVSAKRG